MRREHAEATRSRRGVAHLASRRRRSACRRGNLGTGTVSRAPGERPGLVRQPPKCPALHGLRSRFYGIELTVRYPRNFRGPGVLVHRTRSLDPHQIVVVGGIATTSPARTIVDVARLFPDRELARILDHAIATRVVYVEAVVAARGEAGRGVVAGLARLDRVLAQQFPRSGARERSGNRAATDAAGCRAACPDAAVRTRRRP